MGEERIRDISRQESMLIVFKDGSLTDDNKWDIIFTTERLILVKTQPRRQIPSVYGLVPILLFKAVEKYQQITKDRKLDIDMINALIKNDLAITTHPNALQKCTINKRKVPTWKKLPCISFFTNEEFMDGCTIIFEGSFQFKGETKEGIISYAIGLSQSRAKKYIEDNLAIQATMATDYSIPDAYQELIIKRFTK